MCMYCDLLTSIDKLIAKDDSDLEKTLSDAGYAQSGNTVKAISDLEESIVAVLAGQTAELQKVLDKAAKEGLSFKEISTLVDNMLSKGTLDKDAAKLLGDLYVDHVAAFADDYIKKIDEDMACESLTKRTVANYEDWTSSYAKMFKDNADAQVKEYMSNIESNMNGCADAAENAVKTTENYTDSIKDTDKAAEKASERIGGLGEETEKTSEKSEHFGKKSKEAVSGLDKALATAGIVAALTAIALGFSKCNDAAQEFETTSAKIETVADTTKGSMKLIDKAIIDLSYDTGQAANDLAESTYDAISSGVDTAAAVQFVSDANELAVGGFTSVANSVDVLSTALNSYNLSSDQARQISDYLIVTQNLGKTTVDELASSVARVIPLASAYNVQMDNLSSAYAVLTSNGIDTAEATTYIRGMLAELADTGSKVSSVLEEKTGSSFANLMENGYSLGDVLQILGDSVDGNATALANGTLNPEQAKKFIQQTFDATNLGGLVRHVRESL